MTQDQGIASVNLDIMNRIKAVVHGDDPGLIPERDISIFADPMIPAAVDAMFNKVGDAAMLIAPSVDAFITRPRFNKRLRVTYHVDIWVFERILDRKKDPSDMKVMGIGDAIYRRLMYHDLRSQTEPHGFLRARSGGNVAEFRAVSDTSSMISEVTMRFFGEKDLFL